MTDCQTAREAVMDALVNGMRVPAEAEQHVSACTRCQAERQALTRLWSDLGRLPAPASVTPPAQDTWRRAHAPVLERTQLRRPLLVAVLASLMLGGVAGYFARGKSSAVAPAGPAFLLLLHEAVDAHAPLTDAQEATVVEEYRAWANRLAAEQRLVAAEKLRDDAGRWLSPAGTVTNVQRADLVSGYFVIRARDYEEALGLARAAPHLKYGGTIEVRAIERTSP